MQKSEKSIMIYMKNCKIGALLMKILVVFLFFAQGNSGYQDFLDFSILRYVGVAYEAILLCKNIYIAFLRIHFLNFSQNSQNGVNRCINSKSSSFSHNHRCVPKIGFSADISIDIFIDIFIDILTDIFIDISIDILVDISIDILIDILTDEEEGGGRKE